MWTQIRDKLADKGSSFHKIIRNKTFPYSTNLLQFANFIIMFHAALCLLLFMQTLQSNRLHWTDVPVC